MSERPAPPAAQVADAPVVDAATTLLAEHGLRLDPSTRERLVGYLRRTRSPGESPHEQALRLRRDPAARGALVDEMTVQETSFFRDPAQLAVLSDVALPSLPDPVVVWSAGCANGQEAYSVAMVLLERGRQGLVHATDLSAAAVTRASEAVYAERELRGLSEARRDRWMRPLGDGRWRVADEVRERVHVQQHDLLAAAPPVARVPVVLCRNVLIYFPPDAVRRALTRFASVLDPDGWLFLGFSESLWKIDDRFVAHRHGTSYTHRPARTPAPASDLVARPARRAADALVRRPQPRPPGPRATVPAPGAAVPELPELPELLELLATGERALRGGDTAAAVTAFRAATFVSPAHVLAHLQLSLALREAGEGAAARRALLAARHALDTPDGHGALDGWDDDALRRFIAQRLAEGPA